MMTKAEQFFFENAGFSYDPKTETPEQGKLKCAQAQQILVTFQTSD